MTKIQSSPKVLQEAYRKLDKDVCLSHKSCWLHEEGYPVLKEAYRLPEEGYQALREACWQSEEAFWLT